MRYTICDYIFFREQDHNLFFPTDDNSKFVLHQDKNHKKVRELLMLQ